MKKALLTLAIMAGVLSMSAQSVSGQKETSEKKIEENKTSPKSGEIIVPSKTYKVSTLKKVDVSKREEIIEEKKTKQK